MHVHKRGMAGNGQKWYQIKVWTLLDWIFEVWIDCPSLCLAHSNFILPFITQCSLWNWPLKYCGSNNYEKLMTLYMTPNYHSGNFIWANPKISNAFSHIFPSFVHLLSTKPMSRSRAPGQFLGGQWGEYKAEFWLFFLSNFQNSSNFQTFYYF